MFNAVETKAGPMHLQCFREAELSGALQSPTSAVSKEFAVQPSFVEGQPEAKRIKAV
eukprot:m.44663 g.44663  ORF g.44663 m.44663 type:complete len:57 (+) comp13038_c0_seq4:1362-1532(+)